MNWFRKLRGNGLELEIAWLKGLMDGEGSVGMNPRQIILQLHTKDIELINKARALYDKLGIEYKEYTITKYHQERLVIHRKADIKKFASFIGFGLKRQQDKLKNLIATFK